MSDEQQKYFDYPDFEWYSKQSQLRSMPVRCSYANVHTCPRYYQSWSQLGASGIATPIALNTDQSLL